MTNSTRFEPTWESLRQYTVPDWYADGKFGIFIHWGVYSVPAFANEWYPRNMYVQGTPEYAHHLATYGPHTEFGYKDFIPQFRAEHFDPVAWADLFHRAGARFVVPVAEHHDGFAMYDCSTSHWTAVHMGPNRDIIGELAQAVRNQGMVFGLSSHRAEHWWFMNGGRNYPSDVQDPAYADFYGPAHRQRDCDGTQRTEFFPSLVSEPHPSAEYLNDWLARTCELVDKYQPQLVWFDWWIGHAAFPPYLQQFAAYYYNRALEWGKGVAINYKFSAYPEGTAVLDVERGQLKEIRPMLWQNDTSVSKNSWCFVENQDYKTATSLIQDLVDVVSKNGALLLNIGPRPDGVIPEPEQAILLEIGRWLAVNGDAIYGTRPWRVYGEGPTEVPEGAFTDTNRAAFTARDFRFTTKGNELYAICLDWPGATAIVRSLARGELTNQQITNVHLLGVPHSLDWFVDEAGLHVTLPAEKPCEHAYVLRITLSD
ncbi:MAG: alpha-L-fucosidase [Anaerolineales bacterium]|nr:alpha-L-fucosidase [Anaerolineales bacterium]